MPAEDLVKLKPELVALLQKCDSPAHKYSQIHVLDLLCKLPDRDMVQLLPSIQMQMNNDDHGTALCGVLGRLPHIELVSVFSGVMHDWKGLSARTISLSLLKHEELAQLFPNWLDIVQAPTDPSKRGSVHLKILMLLALSKLPYGKTATLFPDLVEQLATFTPPDSFSFSLAVDALKELPPSVLTKYAFQMVSGLKCDDSSEKRRYAIEILPLLLPSEVTRVLPSTLLRLDHFTEVEKACAVELLGCLPESEVVKQVSVLSDSLNIHCPKVCCSACRVAAKLPVAELVKLVPRLLHLLTSSEVEPRVAAMKALDPLPIEELVTILPGRLPMLKCEDTIVRKVAVNVLSKLPAHELLCSVPYLLNGHVDEHCALLGNLNMNDQMKLVQALRSAVCSTETGNFSKLHPQVLAELMPELLQLLEVGSADVRKGTVGTLGQLPLGELVTLLPQLTDLLDDSSPKVRNATIKTLAKLPTTELVQLGPRLIRSLGDSSWIVQIIAARVLGLMPIKQLEKEDAALLVELFEKDVVPVLTTRMGDEVENVPTAELLPEDLLKVVSDIAAKLESCCDATVFSIEAEIVNYPSRSRMDVCVDSLMIEIDEDGLWYSELSSISNERSAITKLTYNANNGRFAMYYQIGLSLHGRTTFRPVEDSISMKLQRMAVAASTCTQS